MPEGLPKGLENKESKSRLVATSMALALVLFYLYNEKKPDSLPKEVKEKLEVRFSKLQKNYRSYVDSGRKPGYITGEDITELVGLYVCMYAPMAEKIQQEYKIPASIVMAQALIESDKGTSDVALLANNHFGIKHHKHCRPRWSGKNLKCCIQKPDDEDYDRFKKYKNIEDCFVDYVQVLKKKNYKACFSCEDSDYKCWAEELEKAGYATNPRYAEMLIDLIKQYGLDALDDVENYKIKPEDLKHLDK